MTRKERQISISLGLKAPLLPGTHHLETKVGSIHLVRPGVGFSSRSVTRFCSHQTDHFDLNLSQNYFSLANQASSASQDLLHCKSSKTQHPGWPALPFARYLLPRPEVRHRIGSPAISAGCSLRCCQGSHFPANRFQEITLTQRDSSVLLLPMPTQHYIFHANRDDADNRNHKCAPS